LTLNF
jgi:hypothetical protein